MKPGFWSRVKRAQIVQVLAGYAGASWLVLEIASVFIDEFGLPGWFFQAAILLLLIGVVILRTTAWVQLRAAASPTAASASAPREVDLVEIKDDVASGRLPRLTWAALPWAASFLSLCSSVSPASSCCSIRRRPARRASRQSRWLPT